MLALACAGCTRAFYRLQADHEVRALIREKSHNPDCLLPGFTVQPDPRSRMYDPFCADHPPMPPDDPAAHRLMHCVDCKKGYPHWHAHGDVDQVESPAWHKYLGLSGDGVLILDSRHAVKLAWLNSPRYQRELETLYLSALDVSAERFRFDKQFFGSNKTDFKADGPLRSPTGRSSSRLSMSTVDARAEKVFTTGAELVVGLANSIVWEFSGPDTNVTTTLLDFTFVQPLLRRAGRDRVMETLTISERALLANVRQLERFRHGFYVSIMTGRSAGPGPNRRGGFFGVSGLDGFAGVGGGGFGRIGSTGSSAGFGGGGAGAGQAGGFMGLLQTQQDIRNQEANIAGLRSNLNVLRDTLEESLKRIPETDDEILRQRLQIAQARQALFNSQSRLLNTHNDYQETLDDFKSGLGLPPHVCIEIDDPMLDIFELIDITLVGLQNELNDLQERVGVSNQLLLAGIKAKNNHRDQAQDEPIDDLVKDELVRLLSYVTRVQEIRHLVETDAVVRIGRDIDRLKTAVPRRQNDLKNLREKFLNDEIRAGYRPSEEDCQVKVPANVDPTVFDIDRLEQLPQQLEGQRVAVQGLLTKYGTKFDQIEETLQELVTSGQSVDSSEWTEDLEERLVFGIPSVLSDLVAVVLDLSLLQARARADQIHLIPVDLSPARAFEIAGNRRLDWKNARAALVDAWRLIEFNADDLESGLDLSFSGDIGNVGNNPARLRDTNGRLRVGLKFDAPFTRLQERNTYRQSLIEYQQARRAYYRFVDDVSEELRDTIRSMEANRLNFEQQRLAVLGAIDQIVLNTEIQTLTEQRGATSGVTAARDAVSALADLQDAQNNFVSVWVNYEVLRRGLDWDLGTMRLDGEGFWLDPGPIDQRHGYPTCPLDCDHDSYGEGFLENNFVPEVQDATSEVAERHNAQLVGFHKSSSKSANLHRQRRIHLERRFRR